MNVGPNLNDEPVTAHVKWIRQIISGGSVDTAAISRQQTDRALNPQYPVDVLAWIIV